MHGFGIMLIFAVASIGADEKSKCVLIGFWINSQGSNMTIDFMNDKGKFSNLYHTTVTTTRNEIKISLLQESQHPKNKVNQPTFGFIINWSFSDSTTVFMGQCFVDHDRKEILRTTWLLRQEVGNLKDWKVTSIGSDVFAQFQ